MQKRRIVWLMGAGLLAAALAGLVGFQFLQGRLDRPNVVLVIVDTLRADALGSYGAPPEASPELDRIAAEGAVFTDVIAQCSWTRPSMGSLITSRYPRTLGLYKEAFDILPDRFQTIAELFQKNGYTTIGATANPTVNSVFNFHQGFDIHIDSSVAFRWMGEREGQKTKGKGVPLAAAPDIFSRVLDEVRRGKGNPYYLQLTVMEVHEGWKLVRPEFRKNVLNLPLSKKTRRRARYHDSVRQISHDLDRFFQEVLRMPGWEDTLFIITSDHGEGLNDHPSVPRSRFHGHLLYESQLQVPLIWYRPAHRPALLPEPFGGLAKRFTPAPPKGRFDTPLRLLDLMPSLLEYLGIDPPGDVDGASFAPLLRGEGLDAGRPPYFIAETYYRGSDKIAVYGPEWKYIENRDRHRGTNLNELQRRGSREDGLRTDMITKRSEESVPRKRYLGDWEEKYARAAPEGPAKGPSEEEIRQLRSLGYLK